MADAAWALARAQHWVITAAQLLAIGFSRDAIEHRVSIGRLFRLHQGVFGVGRPALEPLGRWKAAELAIGGDGGLMLDHAAAFWGMTTGFPAADIALAIPLDADHEIPGLRTHRRCARVMREIWVRSNLRVTSPVCTLVDLAAVWEQDRLEAAIGEADKGNVIRADDLRVQLERLKRVPGVKALRTTLDRHTFTLTHSRLERLFRPIARRAGLGRMETQRYMGSSRVDFHFPDLGLVVETDGLRYHRTAAQQTADLRRDQAHLVAGRERVRFSHAQIRYHPDEVEDVCTRTRLRLKTLQGPGPEKPSA